MPVPLDPLRPRRIRGVGPRADPLSFSPDDAWLAAGCQGGSIALVDVSSGAVTRIAGPDRDAFAGFAAFAPDSSRLVWSASSPSGSAELFVVALPGGKARQVAAGSFAWIGFSDPSRLLLSTASGIESLDLESGRVLWSVPGLRLVALHAGRATAVDGARNRILELDAGSGEVRAERDWPDAVQVQDALADGRVVFCPGSSGPVTLRKEGRADVQLRSTDELRIPVAYQRFACPSITFSPDGDLAAAIRWPRSPIWNTATGEIVASLPEITAFGCAFSADGRIATGSEDDVLLWPLRARIARGAPPDPGEELVRTRAHAIWEARGRPSGSGDSEWFAAERDARALAEAWTMQRVVFSPDGRSALSVHRFEALRRWDVESGNLLSVHRWHRQDLAATSRALDQALFLDTQAVEHVQLRDRAAGEPVVRTWNPPWHEDYRDEVACCAQDGAAIVVVSRHVHHDSYVGDVFAVVHRWDPLTGHVRELCTTRAYYDYVLALSERRYRLLIGAVSPTIQILSAHDGQTLWTYYAPGDPTVYRRGVTHAAWRSDGEVAAAVNERELFLIDVQRGGEPRRLATDVHGQPVFGASGQLLAVVNPDLVVILDTATGRVLREHREEGVLHAARFSDDERSLCVVHEDGPPFVPRFRTVRI